MAGPGGARAIIYVHNVLFNVQNIDITIKPLFFYLIVTFFKLKSLKKPKLCILEVYIFQNHIHTHICTYSHYSSKTKQ